MLLCAILPLDTSLYFIKPALSTNNQTDCLDAFVHTEKRHLLLFSAARKIYTVI